ncbi:MAG: MmcQ/YjbR family DNA-binding protein [Ramlibacter sp.]|jgi:predicted DNA-binding protein (MmcQ/YjbR family)|nr:MmcQ/YjbR family DNA-binding protein [Ramlibacter sp.]
MATHAARFLKPIKNFALSLPGTQPKAPWPGHDDVAVNDKTFLYLGVDEGRMSVGVKLPVSGVEVLRLPQATRMAYGLGKSGWVTVTFGPDIEFPLDTVKRWILESYRAQAPKRLVKELEATQPWVGAGELPVSARKPPARSGR